MEKSGCVDQKFVLVGIHICVMEWSGAGSLEECKFLLKRLVYLFIYLDDFMIKRTQMMFISFGFNSVEGV